MFFDMLTSGQPVCIVVVKYYVKKRVDNGFSLKGHINNSNFCMANHW